MAISRRSLNRALDGIAWVIAAVSETGECQPRDSVAVEAADIGARLGGVHMKIPELLCVAGSAK